jgi:hypothetical protein
MEGIARMHIALLDVDNSIPVQWVAFFVQVFMR